MKHRVAVLLEVFLLFASGAAWGQAETGTLTVFAAASLTDAFEELATAFETAHPGVDVIFSFGNSSTLATQIVEGAPADVFASANVAQMEVAIASGRIAEDVQSFARNRLIVVMPADNPAGVESLRDLAKPGLRLILASAGIPAREYADTMLERMSADPEYGATFAEDVLANLASEEETVRAMTAKVALGEADAAIVYVSDVTPDIRDQVVTLEVPEDFNTIAQYPIAAISESPAPELAAQFIDFVLSSEGQTVLETWGLIGVCEPFTASEATPEALDATAEPGPESTPEVPTLPARPPCGAH